MKSKCPICNVPAKKHTGPANRRIPNRYFPFCSERCKLIDLGAWLDAQYTIPQSQDADDADSDNN